jgi:hypothetical protein
LELEAGKSNAQNLGWAAFLQGATPLLDFAVHTRRQIINLVETHASNINKLLVPKPRRTSCMSIDIEEYPAKYQVGCSINHPHELVLTSIGAHASLQSPRQIAL